MKKQILVVDDSSSIRQLLTAYLQSVGHEVEDASGGRSGLQKAKTKRYDMVITDQNMPGMEGLQLVKELRELPEYQTTPILVLTTETDESMKAKFRAAGASGWMSKPFAPERMDAALAKLLPS